MPDPDAPPSVPVKTFLRPSTYRQLTGHAAQRGMTVAELVSKLADASLKPVPKRKRVHKPHVFLDNTQRAEVRELVARGHHPANVAALFEVSEGTVKNILKEPS